MNARLALAQSVAALTPWSTEVVEIGGVVVVRVVTTGPGVNPTSLVVRSGADRNEVIATAITGEWERVIRFDSLGDLRSAARKIVFG
jgi:hypothetical protein